MVVRSCESRRGTRLGGELVGRLIVGSSTRWNLEASKRSTCRRQYRRPPLCACDPRVSAACRPLARRNRESRDMPL
ncbi:hypothetical protein PAHAL_5G095900 [Panicum hallii]|uniref:Uncharacterized protein n=1 Tax=Panicum hallii TaxID=206008 RepID=A0A2S3HQN3_9POAL|nr:hypothetical protein PAHAL_5G095900 [Panicum hallii]